MLSANRTICDARSRCASALVLAVALVPARAGAVDRFEIQVYDGSANLPGVVSLENHINFVDRGSTVSLPPMAPTEHQAHWTFEGALGATRVWEAGAYFQTALVPGVGYTFAGAKLRSKFVTPEGLVRHWRLGANFEIAGVPERFEEDRWSVEVRPIAALTLPTFLFAVNPILGFPLTASARSGPHFEPAVSAKGRFSDRVALGLEYYAGFGPLGAVLPVHEQDHYLFGAGDYDLGAGFDLNLGVGVGLSDASDPVTFKAIVAYEFGRIF